MIADDVVEPTPPVELVPAEEPVERLAEELFAEGLCPGKKEG